MEDIFDEQGENFSLIEWELLERTVDHSGSGVKRVRSRTYFTRRAKTVGGWLVQTCEVQHGGGPGIGESAGTGIGLTFVPDPNYEWTLPKRDA